MEFGKLANISQVDFTLPKDHSDTLPILQKKSKNTTPKIFVGCPVWANMAWKGKIYPKNAKSTDFLELYARQFNCIELNLTHYRIPDFQMIRKWKKVTPPEFRFCPKIFQGISHHNQLQNVQSQVLDFVEILSELEFRLGLSFLQLPPHFSPQKADILIRFLENFPKGFPLSVEFRHPDWFSPKFEDITNLVFEKMKNLQISSVITDTAGRRDVIHQRLTIPTAVIRFVGNCLHPSDYQRVDDWIQRLKIWLDEGLENIYFWVHEPENILAPNLVAYFIQELNQELGFSLKKPRFLPQNIQTSLF